MFSVRETAILKLLINEKEYITAQAMASQLNVSKKTIQRTILSLNEELRKQNCFIETVKSRGYRCPDEQKRILCSLLAKSKTDVWIPTIQQTRTQWLIMKFIVLNYQEKPVTIQALADELFISDATLKNDMKQVRQELSTYHLRIEKYKDKGLVLAGDELDIRKALMDYLADNKSECALNEMISITSEEHTQLEHIVIESIRRFQIPITDMGFTNLLIHIEIALSRLRLHKMIESHGIQTIEKENDQLRCARDIAEKLTKEFHCEIPEIELWNIYQHLIAQKKIFNKADELEVDEGMQHMVCESLTKISKMYHVDFVHDKVLVYGLLAHLDAALNRIRYQMQIKNDMLEDIRCHYPYAMELAGILASDLERTYHTMINQDEIGFLALHFCGSMERNQFRISSKQYRVAVVCSTGVGTSMLINSRLHSIFQKEIQLLGTFASYQLQSLQPGDCDLIISTIPLQDTKGIPVIYVTPLLREDDLKKIKNFLRFGTIKKQEKISDLFKEELFFTNLEFENKQACIEYLSSQLLQKGYIDKVCKQSFLEREEMATTEIGNLISVPHSVQGKIYQNAICVGILKSPMLWTYGEVQIVLMIAVDPDDIHKENEFFLHVYQKFDPIYKAKNMIEKKNIKDMKELFSEEELI